MTIPPFPPSGEYWLGSDHYGRDILSRLVVGTKEVLAVVLSVVLIRYSIAIPLGLGAFYYRPVRALLQFLNQTLSFVPMIFIVLFFLMLPYVYFSPHRTTWLIIILAVVEVGRVGDVLYKQTEEISYKPFMDTAITSGNTSFQMLRRYYFPQLFPHMAVNVSLDISRVMFVIGQLGLIQVFISHKIEALPSVTTPAYKVVNTSNAWPVLFQRATADVFGSVWIPFAGAGAITIFVVGFYLLGNGIRHYFEKRQSYI
nr:ABC transporter permease subunit [Pontibacillus sp. HN14]